MNNKSENRNCDVYIGKDGKEHSSCSVLVEDIGKTEIIDISNDEKPHWFKNTKIILSFYKKGEKARIRFNVFLQTDLILSGMPKRLKTLKRFQLPFSESAENTKNLKREKLS